MKKIILIMLTLLAMAGRAWADFVKIDNKSLSNGATFSNSTNSNIKSGTATLSSDGKTLTLTNFTLETSKNTAIETDRANLTIVLVGVCLLYTKSGHHGIIINENSNVTITGGTTFEYGTGLEIIAPNRPCVEMKQGSSLKILNVPNVNFSHIEKQSTYCVYGGSGNNGDFTVENSQIWFMYCSTNNFCNLNSITITGDKNTFVEMHSDNKQIANNVKNFTMGHNIKIYPNVTFSTSQKTFLDSSGQPVKDFIRYEYQLGIDDINFLDPNFRTYIRNSQVLNPNLDNYLSEDELNNITSIDVANKNISNLQGLEFFTELTSLNCNQTKISSLNLSANTKLTTLSCAFCSSLTSLNISSCNNLETVNVSGSKFTALDFSGKSKLKTLTCGSLTSLSSLNVSNCSKLQSLSMTGMYGSPLTTLNVSGCTSMKTLDCHGHGNLTSLNISSCSNMTDLDCSECGLTSLTLNSSIKNLNCSNNQLTSLNTSGCTALQTINCSHNQLTIASNAFDNNIALTSLDCSYNTKWTFADIKNLPLLTALNCNSCTTEAVYLTNLPKFTTLDCGNNAIHAFNFKNCPLFTTIGSYIHGSMEVATVDNTGMTQLTFNQEKLGGLFVKNNSKLTSLTFTGNTKAVGMYIENNPLLNTIDCSNSMVGTLSMSELPQLTSLNCSNNQLTGTLDMSAFTALQTLNCCNNQFEDIVLNECKALQEVNFEGNTVTSVLSLTDMPNLRSLKTVGNQLQVINIINCPQLATLTFTPTAMTALILNNTGLTEVNAHEGLFYTFHIMNNAQLQTLDCSGNNISTFSLVNCPKLKTINLSNNPLNSSTIYSTDMPQGQTPPNCSYLMPAIETLDFSNSNLYRLAVIGCQNITSIDCSNSPNMQELNISQCPALTTLHFDNARQVAINDTGLTEIIFDGSNFQEDKSTLVDFFRNPDLTTFKWNNSKVEMMSITNSPLLQNVDVSNNHLRTLNISDCTDDAQIFCQNNRLDLTATIGQLPNKANRTIPSIHVFDASSKTEQNVCDMNDVSNATQKGWDVMYFDGTEWLPYLGCDYPTVPTALNALPAAPDTTGHTVLYNLHGQKVSSSYKGIVILDGKKIRRK